MAIVEQRMNIKFRVRLGKSSTKTNELLKHVYDTVSRTQASERHRGFREVTWKSPQSPHKQKIALKWSC
ncbi:hypothetical protein TNCV_3831571 [Trichonephila clavipes]|nr:hypothetical protein TNCV_3831571 [Trichonephila clavipes]